jgi:hypothetical protein
MKTRLFAALWLGWTAAAAPPQLHCRIAAKNGPAEARQWTLTIAGDGQTAVTGAAIRRVEVVPAPDMPCRPAVKAPARFPLAIGDLPAGGTASASITLDFSGCPNQARFNVRVQLTGEGGASGNFERHNEHL